MAAPAAPDAVDVHSARGSQRYNKGDFLGAAACYGEAQAAAEAAATTVGHVDCLVVATLQARAARQRGRPGLARG